MKHKRASMGMAIVSMIILFFCSCPTPVPPTPPATNTPVVVPPVPPVFSAPEVTPYMSVIDNKIFYTTSAQEYSLDNQTSWTDCVAGSTTVAFIAGNKVWVREKTDHAKFWYLGEVKAVSGMPDLFPSERPALLYNDSGYWYESDSFKPNQAVRIYYKIKNLSSTASGASCTLKFYLSSDTKITDADTLLYTVASPRKMSR